MIGVEALHKGLPEGLPKSPDPLVCPEVAAAGSLLPGAQDITAVEPGCSARGYRYYLGPLTGVGFYFLIIRADQKNEHFLQSCTQFKSR